MLEKEGTEIMAEIKFIEYKCSYCGKLETRGKNSGRPYPGTCPRKTGDKPHSWIINKKI